MPKSIKGRVLNPATVKAGGRDNIAIFGSLLGCFSIFLGWLTLKPNRLAQGNSLSLPSSFGIPGEIVIIGLWLACLAISFWKVTKHGPLILGILANLLLVSTVVFCGIDAENILKTSAAFSRVSLSSGIWFSFIGIGILIFASSRRLNEARPLQNLIRYGGLLAVLIFLVLGGLNSISLVQEYLGQKARFIQELQQHVILFSGSLIIGCIIGIPLGIWAALSKKSEKPIFYFANITQTIPSLALFGILIAPLSALSQAFPVLRQVGIRGIGTTPAIVALVVYSLLPIVQNTFTGIKQIDPAIIEAGKGSGMSPFNIFKRIQLPLAAPLILEGTRTAAVQAVGNTAVAALIGAGGLGQLIFQGLGQAAADLVLLGSIPIIILAIIVDRIVSIAVNAASPKGLGIKLQ